MKPLCRSLFLLDCFMDNLAINKFRLILPILLENIHRTVEIVIELYLVPCHECDINAVRYAMNDSHVLEKTMCHMNVVA